MDNYILQTKNLCKTFKKQRAVNNISLSIEQNSVYGLLGPNGAGKSTILKMITGMLRPTLFGTSDSRINEVLKIVDLTDTGEKRSGQFSYGLGKLVFVYGFFSYHVWFSLSV